MAVKLRLARVGRHKDPFYRIVAADSRYARDGRYIEQVGFYDPSKVEKKAVIDEALALKWLLQGAQPSDTVRALLKEQGLISKFAETKLAIKKSGK
ncbi:MAG TPA: 30S ribosomal protein S16 [Bacilli bacterium]|jgi:small subunit ribosomal protein S16|nr:30S ribosomal protein S16 [Bacilli bacterium]